MKKTKLLGVSLIFLVTIFSSCTQSQLNNDFCDCATTPVVQTIGSTTLVIPNIITPNNDGKNDYWQIINIGLFPDCKVKVMKSGLFSTVVFESTGYANPWNGDEKDGLYKYEITIGSIVINGNVCVYSGKKYSPSDFDCILDCTAYDSGDPLIGL
jgi:gliding motility-associated-like protein